MLGGFQSGPYDASPNVTTGRVAAWVALVLSVLWVGGIGSLVAIPMGGLSLVSGAISPSTRWAAIAAIVFGVIGLAVSLAMFSFLMDGSE